MGQKDNSLLSYLGNQERFADFFNGIVFEGKSVIAASELEAQDTTFVMKEGTKKKKSGYAILSKKLKWALH